MADNQFPDYKCTVINALTIAQKETVMGDTKDMFESIIESNQAAVVEKSFQQLLTMGITAKELLTALQSPSFSPYLESIKIPVLGAPETLAEVAEASAATAAAPSTGKRRGRPPGAHKKAKKAAGTYTTYSEGEKDKMRRLILKSAEKSPKISTPELVDLLGKDFEGLAEHVAKKLIHDMVEAKNLKMVPGRPNRYQVGKVELE